MKPILEHSALTVAAEMRRWFLFDKETGQFIWNRLPAYARKDCIGKPAGRKCGGYLTIRVLGRSYKAHRLVWAWHTGEWPKHQLDHINMDKSDNRFCNLREATASQNCMNRGSKKRELPMGVRKRQRGRYRAEIRVDGKILDLGGFDNAIEATEAYLAARLKHYGKYAEIGAKQHVFAIITA